MKYKRPPRSLNDYLATQLSEAGLSLSLCLTSLEFHGKTTDREYHAIRGLREHCLELMMDYINKR